MTKTRDPRIKALATRAGRTGVQIATRYGVTPAAVSHWLNGRTPVPDELKIDFAAYIGVRLEDLLPQPKDTTHGTTTGLEERTEEPTQGGGEGSAATG